MASCLLLLAFVLLIVVGKPCPSSYADEALDSQALNAFKTSVIADPLNALGNWNNITHHCNWSGVACDTVSNVVSIALLEKRLEGVISPFLANLSHLTSLDLSFNSFHGPIPEQLTQCLRLKELTLSENSLTGSIPYNLGRLVRLESLDLANNFLAGSIPDTIGNCTSLTAASFSNNRLFGPIPSALGCVRNLTGLDLSKNFLQGSIPFQLGNLTKLKYLNLSQNQLEGQVPEVGVLRSFNWSSFEGNDNLCGVNSPRSCPQRERSHHQRRHIITVAASVVAAAAFLCLIVLLASFLRPVRKRPVRAPPLRERPVSTFYMTPTGYYSKNRLERWTDSFNRNNIIRSSDTSIIYKGLFNDVVIINIRAQEGVPTQTDPRVLVNVFKIEISEEVKRFLSRNVPALMRIKHQNLVKVIGYCCEDRIVAIVTEFVPNGNLDTAIHGGEVDVEEGGGLALDLNKRIDISICTADALVYLHDYCGSPIVHCHLNPTNILLDEDLEAHVSDLGTAGILWDHLQRERRASSAGRISYVAPELENTSQVTPKVDVYSFGVILMELLTRRRPSVSVFDGGKRMSLREWIEIGVKGGSVVNVVDPAMAHISKREAEKMVNLLKISLLCTRETPSDRPTMAQVLSWLFNIKQNRMDGNFGSESL